MGLWYSKDTGMSLTTYSDADHTGCQDTRRSTSGSAQFLSDKLVSWSSKKQKSNLTDYGFTFNKILCTATTKVRLLYAATTFNTQEPNTSININPVAAQQVALDNALVAPEKRLKIEKGNARIDFSKPQRETTYQVTLDALKLSPCYPAFLITAEVPEIYPRLPNQDFVEPPFEEEMVRLFKELRYTGKCDMLSEIHTDHMHQPWRTFVAVINRFYLWEDFMFQADNREISSAHYQKYGALIPKEMINQAIKDSKAYKIYLDIATGKATPKKARKFKKIASPSQKLTTVLNELKEKTTHTNEGTGTIPRVPDVPKFQSESENESWGDRDNDDDSNDDDNDNDSDDDSNKEQSDDDHEQVDDERKESDDDEEEKQDDEYVHTTDFYVPTDEETNDESKEFDEEEYEDLYGDVKINLKDVEPADKEKGNVEMTNTETCDAELKNVNQEGVGNQVKDDAQATQMTEGLIPSSSISSDYVVKYLYFDNIPLVDTEVVSMLDINVQHEVPRTSPLLTILVSVIPEHTVVNPPEIVKTASSATISSLLITNLEKDVKGLKIVDHFLVHLSTFKFEVPKAIKEYLGTTEVVERLRQQYVPEKSSKDIRKIKMEHARKQQEPKATITSSDTSALEEVDQKTTLFQTMTNLKSFNRSPKQRALYHALMELILEDEDTMDGGVAD
ncbi:retrovirus-related pol polyprotein from transposon TNT 1-94 [Tanacetum coccineum]